MGSTAPSLPSWRAARIACACLALLSLPLEAAAEDAIGLERARAILFEAVADAASGSCNRGSEQEQIACLLRVRFKSDRRAAETAVALYEKTGTVAGLLPEQDFDGGYRGPLHLVPRLPVARARHHLEWTAAALVELDGFFAALAKRADRPLRYRWKPLELRYFESVKRRTPAAWASGWTVAYNLAGTLQGSPATVRETLFHEIFHLNDFAHRSWSQRALGDVFERIVARCGTRTRCLAPFSPDGIIVKGGTYYAFQPGNGVQEYAADLAQRYFREQRAALRGEAAPRAFKCLAPENAEAWARLVDEFFAGVDLVPACDR